MASIPEIILAIYGVESNFGTRQGKRNVLRSLLTLAAIGYREEFFRKELIACLKIIDLKEANPGLMKGSWAGAMGSTQFMPTSYLRFSVDHDRDGLHDIWTNVPDSLASIANFLKAHGWQAGRQWGAEVVLPEDFKFGAGLQPGAHWRSAGVKRRDGRPIPAGDSLSAVAERITWPGLSGVGKLRGAEGVQPLRPLCDLDRSHRQSHGERRHGHAGLAAHRQAAEQGAAARAAEAAQGAGPPDPEKEARIDLEEREVIRLAQKSLGMTMDGNPSEELLRRLRGSE